MEHFEDIVGKAIAGAAEEPPEGLSRRVFSAVVRRRRRAAAWKGLAFLGASACAAFAFAYAWRAAGAEFSSSGTFQIASLLFSDFHAVIANWYDFTFSVLESLPIVPVVGVLASVLSFILLAYAAAVNFTTVRRTGRYRTYHYV